MSSSSLFTIRPLHCPPARFLSKPFSSSKTLTLNSTKTVTLIYGPSLSKGRNPNPSSGEGDGSIDRSAFSRAFEIAALRVPAAECSTLERRLRGHLLNWPRVRNVARSPGDDVDPEIKNLIIRSPSSSDRLEGRSGGEEEILSPVLYREKLAKDFNYRGFIRFRNLAKISRPKKNKKREEREGGVKERGKEENCYEFEVVGSGSGRDEEEMMKGLLGEEFSRVGRWRGPTRLLLLDERYANKGAEELPEAIKVTMIYS